MTAFEILSNVSRNKRPETLNPLVQLRIAANYRLQQKNGEQATLLSEHSQRDDQYSLFARCEIQVDNMPSAPLLPLINLPKRSERPFLDGVLKYKTLYGELDNPKNHFIYNEQKQFLDFVFDGYDITKAIEAGKKRDNF